MPRSASSGDDPEESAAAELLAAMMAELNDLYGTASRLDLPGSGACRAAAAAWCLPGRVEGLEAVTGGGVRDLAGVRGDQADVRPPARPFEGVARHSWRRARTAAALGYTVGRLDTGPIQVHALSLYRRTGTSTCRRTTTTPSPPSG